jgi:hypothetical protein
VRIVRAALIAATIATVAAPVPAVADEPNVDSVFNRLAPRVQHKLPQRACVFATLTADNYRRHNYVLVDSRKDLAIARRIARASGPARATTVATNPGRFHQREMTRIARALAASAPAPPPTTVGETIRPLSTKHCPPLEIILVQGTATYDELRSWADVAQKRFGADRVLVTALPPNSPLPD